MSEQQKYWFAARTRDKQEFAIRDSLEKLKTELDLNYYLPTQFVHPAVENICPENGWKIPVY